MPNSATRPKPGRKSSIATHPQCNAIETACAAGVSMRRVAERFGASFMAVWRHWRSLSAERRAELTVIAERADDQRWRVIALGLAGIADRHPEARADVAVLAQQLQLVPISSERHARAA